MKHVQEFYPNPENLQPLLHMAFRYGEQARTANVEPLYSAALGPEGMEFTSTAVDTAETDSESSLSPAQCEQLREGYRQFAQSELATLVDVSNNEQRLMYGVFGSGNATGLDTCYEGSVETYVEERWPMIGVLTTATRVALKAVGVLGADVSAEQWSIERTKDVARSQTQIRDINGLFTVEHSLVPHEGNLLDRFHACLRGRDGTFDWEFLSLAQQALQGSAEALAALKTYAAGAHNENIGVVRLVADIEHSVQYLTQGAKGPKTLYDHVGEAMGTLYSLSRQPTEAAA